MAQPLDQRMGTSYYEPWYAKRRWALAIGLLICVLAEIALPLSRNSMEESWAIWLRGGVLMGEFLGVHRFALFGLPPILVLMGVGHVKEWDRTAVCILAVCWAALLSLPVWLQTVEWLRPSKEPLRLKDITALSWPAQSHCHLALHSMGKVDRRHVWAFEGSRLDFQKHQEQLSWQPEKLQASELPRLPLTRVKKALDGEDPWLITEMYSAAERDYSGRRIGTAWLFVDKDRTRWCVGWDGN